MLPNRNSVKRILCIDGVDGCGKGTISEIVKQRLENEGHSVAVISPPFYETKSGQMVKEYLTDGFKDIQDRTIATMLYSIDRNMFYREHFNEIFASGNYDIVLYNRNWLSSVFYQTTMICQTPEDTARILGRRYSIDFEGKSYSISLPIMHDMVQLTDQYCETVPLLDEETCKLLMEYAEPMDIYPKKLRDAIHQKYRQLRLSMLNLTFDLISQMELIPWSNQYSTYFMYEPFTVGRTVRNVVLTPDLDMRHLQYVRQNLMNRYEFDTTKLDMNERNNRYLYAVIENIHWIHQYLWLAFGFEPKDTSCSSGITPLSKKLLDAFKYDIVHTNDETHSGQRDINDIADEVYQLLMRDDPTDHPYANVSSCDNG